MALNHGFNISLFALIHYILLISIQLITTTTADTISTNAYGEYENQKINCLPNEPCNILCQHDNSCKSAEIYCPSNYSCDITCNSNMACESTIIHAQHSSSFKLLDCAAGSFTCQGITIYFPPNKNGVPRAKIIGADEGLSAGEILNNPLQFYAIYGWNDINITTGNKFTFKYHAGVMYCTSNLQISCAFATNSWNCSNINDICNNPPTMSPTITPTHTTTNKQIITTELLSQNNDIKYTPKASAITATTLYIIIVFLLIFLCCFAVILFYYIYYSHAYAQRLAVKSSSRIHTIPSLSMKSNANSGSTINTTSVASPISHSLNIPSTNSAQSISSKSKKRSVNNNNMELMPINANQSSDTESMDNTSKTVHLQHPNSPWAYFANANANNNLVHIQQQQQQHYLTQLMAAQAQLQQQQQQQQVINMNIPQPTEQKYQISIPSNTYTNTNSLSSNYQQIRYQQPMNQHHMLQMMSMMNQSQPPSLSSLINNNRSQPIPPSTSNTSNNSQMYGNNLYKVPQPESVITGLTSCTGTAENSKYNQNDDDISDSDNNIYTRK